MSRYCVAIEGQHKDSQERDQHGRLYCTLKGAIYRAEAHKTWFPDLTIKVIKFGPDRPVVVHVAKGVKELSEP